MVILPPRAGDIFCSRNSSTPQCSEFICYTTYIGMVYYIYIYTLARIYRQYGRYIIRICHWRGVYNLPRQIIKDISSEYYVGSEIIRKGCRSVRVDYTGKAQLISPKTTFSRGFENNDGFARGNGIWAVRRGATMQFLADSVAPAICIKIMLVYIPPRPPIVHFNFYRISLKITFCIDCIWCGLYICRRASFLCHY